MSDAIIMRHPTLPKDQEIEVLRDAMPHYTAAGWQQVPDEELQHRAELKAQAEAEARAAENAASTNHEDQPDEPEQSEPAEAPKERPTRSRAKAADKKDAEES